MSGIIGLGAPSLQREDRGGQPFEATWYARTPSESGEELRADSTGMTFWCMETQGKGTSRAFYQQIQGTSYSLILQSTNLSKLQGIEDGLKVDYNGHSYKVSACRFDRVMGRWEIALI